MTTETAERRDEREVDGEAGRRGVAADPRGLVVPIDRLVDGPSAREGEDPGLELLAESIRALGLVEPLVVRELHRGRAGARGERWFQVIAGHRRLKACRLVGLTEVRATLRPTSDAEAVAAGLAENLCREAPNERETLEAVKVLLETYGWTQAKIARAVGKSRGWISEIVAVLTAAPGLARAVEARQAGITTVAKLTRLQHTAPERYRELADRIAAGEALRNDDVPTVQEAVGPPRPPAEHRPPDAAAPRRVYRPVELPAGVAAHLERQRAELLRTVGQLRAACEEQDAWELPTGVLRELRTIHQGVGMLLEAAA